MRIMQLLASLIVLFIATNVQAIPIIPAGVTGTTWSSVWIPSNTIDGDRETFRQGTDEIPISWRSAAAI